MVSLYLPSDALSQLLLSSLGFSYLGHGVSLHVCSSKAQPLLLTLDWDISSPLPFLIFKVGWLLYALLRPCSHRSLNVVWLFPATAPGLSPRPRALGGSSRPFPPTSDMG